MKEDIHNLRDSDLISMCKDSFNWQKTGLLANDSALLRYANQYKYNPRDLEDEILNEAAARYKDVVSLLMINRPSIFIKK